MQWVRNGGHVGAGLPSGRSLTAWSWFGTVTLVLVAASLWTLALHDFNNTLASHPQWRSTKPQLKYGVMGAVAYTTTPFAVQGERLNLGGFWGYQELLSASPARLQQLSWEAELPPQSHLVVVYGRTSEGFAGVRLSVDPQLPSQRFVANAEGKLLQRAPLALPAAETHRGTLSFKGGQASLEINGREVARWSEDSPQGQYGFRGAQWEVFVDNVVATTTDGEVLRSTFDNPRSVMFTWLRALCVCFLLAVAYTIVVTAWRRLRRRSVVLRDVRRVLHGPLASLVSVALIVLGVRAVSHLRASEPGAEQVWHVISHLPSIAHFGVQAGVGAIDVSPLENTPMVLERLRNTPPPPGGRPILYIGSSQTWGAGSLSGVTWVDQVQKALEQAGGRAVPYVNTGIPGQTAPNLLRFYREEWLRYDPRLVVINLGSNDKNPRKFREALAGFISLNRSRGIKTLLILEANALHTPNGMLPEMHAAMRQVAAEHDVPLIDLHGALMQRQEEGFLWWDFVHLSDLGQRFAAEHIAPVVWRLWEEATEWRESAEPSDDSSRSRPG